MYNMVSSWFNNPPEAAEKEEGTANADGTEDEKLNEETRTPKFDLDNSSDDKDQEPDVLLKMFSTAKNWGGVVYKSGIDVTNSVVQTASSLKNKVEERTIIGDFQREQDKFISTNKEHSAHKEAAIPPWVGYNEEATMKAQILALSGEERNLLRNPPPGVQFHFDFDSYQPIAMSILQEDPRLDQLRFELVPKRISEQNFWRNYFYRVSLIKQSAQLSALTQEGSGADTASEKSTGSQQDLKRERVPSETLPSTEDHEFVSDTFQEEEPFSSQDLEKEMEQLKVSNGSTPPPSTDPPDQPPPPPPPTTTMDDRATPDIDELEAELQQELAEYEMVDEAGLDDPELEKEILRQIEDEARLAKND